MMMSKGSSPLMGGLEDEESEEEKDSYDPKSGKLLALQNLLGAIEDMADEDLKPYIEQIRNKMHMEHEAQEGDDMGVQEAMEHDDMMPPQGKSGFGVEISMAKGMPSKPGMTGGEEEDKSDEEEDDENPGFLSILSKRMSGKPKK